MARSKAKEKITEYLKAKGLDANDIRDAFEELDRMDLTLEDAADKLKQWGAWYNDYAPAAEMTAKELAEYKKKVDALEAAGIKISPTEQIRTTTDGTVVNAAGQYVTPAELAKLQRDMAQATSVIMKDLTRVSLRHLKEFNEEPDLDAIERIVTEKGLPVPEAYRVWSEPKYTAKRDEDTKKTIADGIKEGVKNELSKLGVQKRRAKNQIENAPLDKEAPSDRELKEAFINDLNAEPAN